MPPEIEYDLASIESPNNPNEKLEKRIIGPGASHYNNNESMRLYKNIRNLVGSEATFSNEILAVNAHVNNGKYREGEMVTEMGRSLLAIGKMIRKKNSKVLFKNIICII